MEQLPFKDIVGRSEQVLVRKGSVFSVYRVGERAVKVSCPLSSAGEAISFARRLRNDYLKFKLYLPDFLINTEFVIGESNGIRVIAIQDYLQGISISEAIRLSSDEKELMPIKDFYGSCLRLYQDTGLMPDLFDKKIKSAFYTGRTTPNVIVQKINNQYVPFLVDIAPARTSKLLYTRWFQNGLMKFMITKNIQKLTLGKSK